MTIEEEFFKAFGIEKRKKGYCDWDSWCPYEDLTCGDDCPYWQYSEERYPEITAEKLLDMVSILMFQFQILFYFDYEYKYSSRFSNSNRPICNQCNSFKELIIKTITFCGKIKTLKEEIEQQVRKLFKEE